MMAETRSVTISALPPEILINILLQISEEATEENLWMHLKLVSRKWKLLLENNGFLFQILHERYTGGAKCLKLETAFLKSIPRSLSIAAKQTPSSVTLMTKESRTAHCLDGIFKELCGLRKGSIMKTPLIQEGIRSSSQDHPQQSIGATLSLDPFEFWSSTGKSDTESDEWLLYELCNPICLIHQIEVKPFLAQYQKGLPCYAPKSISFSIGFSEDTFHYHSPTFSMINSPTNQVFTLPALVLGSFVRLNMYGRNQNQPGDLLFYTVLEQVSILGIPGSSLSDSPKLLQSSLSFYNTALSSLDVTTVLDTNKSVSEDHADRVVQYKSCMSSLSQGKWADAIDIMAASPPDSLLRTTPFLDTFKSYFDPEIPHFAHWFRYYVSLHYSHGGSLTNAEALILAQLCVDQDLALFEQGLRRGLIHLTLQLGQQCEESGIESLAFFVYLHGRSMDKILELALKLDRMHEAIEVLYSTFTMEEVIDWMPGAILKYTKHRMAKLVLMYLQILQSINNPAWNVGELRNAMRVAFQIEDDFEREMKEIVRNRVVF